MMPRAFPEPEFFVTDSGEPSLNWGVVAPGAIAGAFVAALHRHTIQRAVVVASRSTERAEAFARQHGIPRAVGSYDELFDDPRVDVVYIAAPQSEHHALGLRAIAAGKHVLIEKPLATNAADAHALADAARAAKVFLMEAMWSRYQPQSLVIRALIEEGVIGDVLGVVADHGQQIPFDPEHRLYRADLGGGALLDLGIYPIQLDSMVLGAPQTVVAVGEMTATGVDAHSTLVLGHGSGKQSTLMTTLLTRTPTTAVILGSEGRIEIAGPFHIPTSLTVSDNGFMTPTHSWTDPTFRSLFDGLSWEATALARYVGEGRTESPLHTLDETVSILATIDEAFRQIVLSSADKHGTC